MHDPRDPLNDPYTGGPRRLRHEVGLFTFAIAAAAGAGLVVGTILTLVKGASGDAVVSYSTWAIVSGVVFVASGAATAWLLRE